MDLLYLATRLKHHHEGHDINIELDTLEEELYKLQNVNQQILKIAKENLNNFKREHNSDIFNNVTWTKLINSLQDLK